LGGSFDNLSAGQFKPSFEKNLDVAVKESSLKGEVHKLTPATELF